MAVRIIQHEISGKSLYIVENLVAIDTCTEFIARAEGTGLLGRAPDVRSSYQRIIFTDTAILAGLRANVLPVLRANQGCEMLLGDELRYNKYYEGDFIAIHLDGINMSRRTPDAFTVNIYLNEGFGGGETVFYNNDRQEVLRVTPRIGTAVVFDPQIYHSGERVTSGTKSILRACIYRGA